MAVTGHMYTVALNNITLSGTAPLDIFSIKASTTQPFALTGIELGQVTNAAVVSARIRIKRTAALTVGSGGSAVTPAITLPGDPAAGAAARVNDTTPATGTFVDNWNSVWNTVNGWLWVPPVPSRPPVVPAGGGFVLVLDTTVSSFVTNGVAMIEEVG